MAMVGIGRADWYPPWFPALGPDSSVVTVADTYPCHFTVTWRTASTYTTSPSSTTGSSPSWGPR